MTAEMTIRMMKDGWFVKEAYEFSGHTDMCAEVAESDCVERVFDNNWIYGVYKILDVDTFLAILDKYLDDEVDNPFSYSFNKWITDGGYYQVDIW